MSIRCGCCTGRASASPRSLANCRSAALPFAGFWHDLLRRGIGQLAMQRHLPNFFFTELAANVFAEIPTQRFRCKELVILMRRKSEVPPDTVTMEFQIELALTALVCHRLKNARIHRHPVDGH